MKFFSKINFLLLVKMWLLIICTSWNFEKLFATTALVWAITAAVSTSIWSAIAARLIWWWAAGNEDWDWDWFHNWNGHNEDWSRLALATLLRASWFAHHHHWAWARSRARASTSTASSELSRLNCDFEWFLLGESQSDEK